MEPSDRSGGCRFVSILRAVAMLLAIAGHPIATSALSLDPNPLLFDLGAIRGEARLISFDTGVPEGAITLDGAVASSDLTAVLEVSLAPESDPIGSLGVFATALPEATPVNPTGAGVLLGVGADISAVTRTASSAVRFAFSGGSLEGGQTADRIFVSFSTLEAGDRFGVLISAPVQPGQPFSRADAVSGTLIPEPGAIVLFALGFVWFARASKRRAD